MSGKPAQVELGEARAALADIAVTLRDVSMNYKRKRRGEEVLALDRVSLEMRDKEFISLLGPSGCGKSTTLKIIAGLLRPTSGDVDVHTDSQGRRRRVGMVFQNPVLHPWRTVLSNVLLPAEIERRRKALEGRAHELLEMAGLEDFSGNYPYELSGGMQQRVALVRALLEDPEILLMDEPFGALDAMTRDQMNLELLRIWERNQKTVIFVTHSIQESVFLSDRIALMSPRPGRLARLMDVTLPRPRTLDAMGTPEFAALTAEVRSALGQGVDGQ